MANSMSERLSGMFRERLPSFTLLDLSLDPGVWGMGTRQMRGWILAKQNLSRDYHNQAAVLAALGQACSALLAAVPRAQRAAVLEMWIAGVREHVSLLSDPVEVEHPDDAD